MKEIAVTHYVKRIQKDYPLSFKLQIVGDVEVSSLLEVPPDLVAEIWYL